MILHLTYKLNERKHLQNRSLDFVCKSNAESTARNISSIHVLLLNSISPSRWFKFQTSVESAFNALKIPIRHNKKLQGNLAGNVLLLIRNALSILVDVLGKLLESSSDTIVG